MKRIGFIVAAFLSITSGVLRAESAPVDDILLARPFTLEEGYEHDWQAERPWVTSGHVVVLRADRRIAALRSSLSPVLCAGSVTVERTNRGYPSGIVVGIIPGDIDLTTALIWFASRGEPPAMTAESIEEERQQALEAGIAPFDPVRVTLALQAGGPVLEAADRGELLEYVRALIDEYAPEE